MILKLALNLSLERGNEAEERPDDGGVESVQTVIVLAIIKEDVVESYVIAVGVREVFVMLDMELVVVDVTDPRGSLVSGLDLILLVNNLSPTQ